MNAHTACRYVEGPHGFSHQPPLTKPFLMRPSDWPLPVVPSLPFSTERDMSDMELVLFANELRTRAKEILDRAADTDDPEAKGMMRIVAAGYEKLARRVEQRVRETEMA